MNPFIWLKNRMAVWSCTNRPMVTLKFHQTINWFCSVQDVVIHWFNQMRIQTSYRVIAISEANYIDRTAQSKWLAIYKQQQKHANWIVDVDIFIEPVFSLNRNSLNRSKCVTTLRALQHFIHIIKLMEKRLIVSDWNFWHWNAFNLNCFVGVNMG